MPWTPPSDPVTSTVITVAYAVANLLTQIRWLRLLTGNADPPATGYVVTSDSPSATSWKTGPTGIASVLGYTPANKAGEDFTGAVSVPSQSVVKKADDAGVGGRLILQASAGQQSAALDVFNNTFRIFDTADGVPLISFDLGSGALTLPSQLILAALNASTSGRISGQAAASTAGYTMDVNGSVWRLFNTADGSKILAFNLTNNVLTAGADTVITSASIGTQSVAFATNAGNAGNANTAGGVPVSTVPSPNRIPVSDASGKLDAWVTPASFSIPSGLGCWVRSAAEIPAGFVRETTLDGLIPIGAGTSFSQTFVEATSYGSTWQHQHGVAALAVPVTVSVSGSATGGASDNTGQPSATGGTASGTPPPSFGTGTHTHSLNGVSLAVSASGGGSGSTTATNTGNTTWLPPMRAVVWARKT